jgi:hypothetical protein
MKMLHTILHTFSALVVGAAIGFGTPALAADPEFTLVIKDHLFSPTEVKVPANTKVKLIVDNQDATAEEFESKELKREKVIPPKSKGTVMIGPLKAGRYQFFGEFHEKTARGVVIAE